MIYYDSTKDIFIPIDKKDFEFNVNKFNRFDTSGNITIKFDYSELKYFKDWFSESQDMNGTRYKSTYVRNIFISDPDGRDIKFINCYITSMELFDFTTQYNRLVNQFEVCISCDHYESGGIYPELKSIYRDKKIDLILK